MISHGLQCFDKPDPWEHEPVGPACALLRGILQPEFDGVKPEFHRQLVDNRLGGKGGVGGPRGAVGACLRFVHHDVVPIDENVRDVVRREDALRRGANGRAGEGPRLVSKVALCRRNDAVVRRPDFHLDI